MPSPDSSVAFGELLAYLRQRGFTIGVGHYLRLQELLNKTGAGCSPQDLKTLLCPIFATNQIQQEQFYRTFDEYYSLFHRAPSEADAASKAQSGEIALQHPVASPVRLHVWLYILGAALLLLLVFYAFMPTATNKAVGQSNSSDQDLPGVDASKQASNQVADEKPTPRPATNAEPGLSFYRSYRATFRAIGIAAPIIIFLFYEWYRFNKRKVILQKQKGRKPPFTWALRVESPPAKLFDSDEFYDAATLMRRRQADEFYRLDIDRTIAATMESLGYPSFRYKFASKPPEYLALIDRASFRDHQAQFFNELMKSLEREGVFVARYFYDGDPRVCCRDRDTGCVHLGDLQNKFAGHRLLIVGNGEKLIDPVTGRLMPWTATFSAWPERAVLTSSGAGQWGLRESSLAGQFVVRPATSEGLRASIESFESSLRSEPYARTKDEAEHADFDDLSMTETVAALRHYLGEETFQWLCACAVYPELQWDLTLYLGTLDCLGKDLVREDNLLKMVRLPWFRKGSIPDELRWHLIGQLDREKERDVRSALIELLEKNPPPDESFAVDSYQLNLVVQRWLSFRDRKRRREMLRALKTEPRSQILQDYTLMRFLESAPESSLAVILPRKFRKLFYQNGIPAFGIKTGFRILLTLTLGATAWFVMRPDSTQSDTNPLQKITQKIEQLASSRPKADMISMPSGTFQMGRSDGAEQEGPPHPVTVGAFSIDRTEVTNAEYAQFVKETGYAAPNQFAGGKPVSGQEQWPVTNVSLDDAKAFAAWRSKRDGVTYRLPTEEEWEFAARDGGNGNIFPWGNTWIDGKANINTASLMSVGTSPDDKTRAGVVDMIGNAYEWTSSKASLYQGNKFEVGPDHQEWVIIRGGAYITDMSKKRISATYRDWIPPTTQNSGLGFRLVRGAQ
jgi:formylglycine-generating enzyme required for sulfatase activity